MNTKLKGQPNVTYAAQTATYTADANGTINTATLGDGDLTALLRQGVTVLSIDGRTTTGSYTPPDESRGLLRARQSP